MRNYNFIHCRWSWLLVILLSILLIVLSCLVIRCCDAPKVVTFNAKKTTALFLKQYATHPLSHVQSKRLAKAFSQMMRVTLNQYAKTHHVVVLNQRVVISKSKDITPTIEQMIAKRMQPVWRSIVGAHHVQS